MKYIKQTFRLVSIFKYFDFFQQSVSLKIENKYRVSLILGRFFTFGILIFLVYSLLESDMLKKTNPIVLQQNLENKEHIEILLSPENFAFSFSLSDDNYFVDEDPRIFSFNVTYVHSFNGGEKSVDYNRDYEKCTFKNFEIFQNEYTQLFLNKTNCLKDGNIRLKGYWDENESYYLLLKVEKCLNTSQNENFCKSEEEIQNFLEDKYFNVYMQQNNFDLSDFENSGSAKLKNYYYSLEGGRKKESRFFLKKNEIISDNDVIFSKKVNTSKYSIDRVEIDSTASKSTLFQFELYSSENVNIFKRRYQKLFDLMAVLGGMANCLILIFSAVIQIVYEWKINEIIMNNLFLIGKKRKILKKGSSSKIKAIKFAKNSDSKDETVEEMRFNFCEKLYLLFKKAKKRNEKENFYVKYLKKSSEKIDLINVLKKLEEIDRLKIILLNPKQLKLFDAMKKKLIYLNGSLTNKRMQFDKFIFNLDNLTQAEQNSTKQYLDSIRNNTQINEIDQRMFNLIE